MIPKKNVSLDYILTKHKKNYLNERFELQFFAEKYNFPEVADLLTSVRPALNPYNGTYTDGHFIYVELGFEKYSIKKQFFYICHEALHILYRHVEMLSEKNEHGNLVYKYPKLLNICQDIVINEKLVSHLKYKMKDLIYLNTLGEVMHSLGIVSNPDSVLYTGTLTTRNLYTYILTFISLATSLSGGSMGDLIDNIKETLEDSTSDVGFAPRPSENEQTTQLDEIIKDGLDITDEYLEEERPIFREDSNADDSWGSSSGKYYTDSALNIDNDTSYKKVLSTREIIKFISTFIGNELVIKGRTSTYLRPSRRLQNEKYPLRGSKPFKTIKKLNIYLDVSGSMSESFVKSMYNTLKTLYTKTKFDLYIFNDDVTQIDINNTASIRTCGGTSINTVLNHITTNNFDVAIMITDCEDRFNIEAIQSKILLFTNDTYFKTNNQNVTIKHFDWRN